ncbi:YDG domain-containing protein [Caenorhabditis elegans]|uniref:YDG domain-containing protein n=1 Tax=Caenorhabditis elegans TaxID=6239 RepID=Q17979_CAEEL|nr:YDG domain-containing protein [Caenorhabditis elegans]CCD64496.1 YDG domain-containing protein [Caenorhabditis elegans]|eukprot:NP_504491.1 Uncharacterized protein CELE_C14C11.2 [Caenorhabditis elegans]
MLPSRSESDDDKYIPSGLLNIAGSTANTNDIKVSEICEFYNDTKPACNVVEKSSRESDVFVDLSGKEAEIISRPAPIAPVYSDASKPLNSPSVASRILTIPPGSHVLGLPGVDPREISTMPSQSHMPTFSPPGPVKRQNVYHHAPLQIPAIYAVPGHPMIHQRPMPYCPPGLLALKQKSLATMQLPVTMINPNAGMYPHVIVPMHPQMAAMAATFNPGLMVVSHPVPVIPIPSNSSQSSQPPMPAPQPTTPEEPRVCAGLRKQLKMEASARFKAERDAQKAKLKAEKLAEKAKTAVVKKKKEKISGQSNRKFSNFSKDMFVIRLKDVDSFDRNNEIWRIDNHVLLQKFCGVPSLRAPARQFQSTNRMSGYDSRATWRLFIINPDNVEVNEYGSEVTIREYPSINDLRQAKQRAELKDGAFSEIEKSEYGEKVIRHEAKKLSREQKRLERKQRKLQWKRQFTTASSKFQSTSDNPSELNDAEKALSNSRMGERDEAVCRDIIAELLDAIEVNEYDDEDSCMYSDLESSSSEDDEEDAGSLISVAYSTDNEDFKSCKIELFQEDELPEVALELTID